MDELSKEQSDLIQKISIKTGLGVGFNICNADTAKHYVITLGTEWGCYRHPCFPYRIAPIIRTRGVCISVGLTIDGLFKQLSYRKDLY